MGTAVDPWQTEADPSNWLCAKQLGERDMSAAIKQFADVFKRTIGLVISFTALASVTVTPGVLPAWKIAILGLAVLISSASAGAFNQYVERDIDARMKRTRGRPFVTGALKHGPFWLIVMIGMLRVLRRGGRVGAQPLVGALRVPRCVLLRGRVYGLAQAPHLDEYCGRRACRQFCSTGWCRRGHAAHRPESDDSGDGFVHVDASTLLELGDRLSGG